MRCSRDRLLSEQNKAHDGMHACTQLLVTVGSTVTSLSLSLFSELSSYVSGSSPCNIEVTGGGRPRAGPDPIGPARQSIAGALAIQTLPCLPRGEKPWAQWLGASL